MILRLQIYLVSFFVIMITNLASLTNANSIMIAYASEYSNISNRICLFSINICLDDQSQQEKSKETDNLVHLILDKVNSTILKNWIDNLTSFQTRHTKSGYIEDVANWLKNELQSVCNGRVYFHNFTQSDQGKGYSLKNIICDQGSALADGKGHHVLISAHYDSRQEDINQSNARAPGADDNASGVAAVLELARVLSKVDLKNNIQFVLFSGEEQGQWGSSAYVRQQQNNDTKLDLVMNLDMVGYPSLGLDNVIIEYDLGNKITTNDAYSKNVAKFIAQIDSEYTNLEASLRTLGKTDLIPFEAIGKIVIGLHDGGSELNPNYHSISDTPDTLDIEYLTSTTKLALATILNLD
jgi:Zn-dependent M28 family amino/carboxypeptidase